MVNGVLYDYFGCTIVEDNPPLLEVGLYGTVEGYIEITTPGITSGYTLDAEVYKLMIPSASSYRYFPSGSDLYDDTILDYSSEIMDNGNVRLFFRFDPYQISGSAHDDYYSIRFQINKLLTASSVKVNTDVIVHIVNKFKDV
jgi:hypothetical protein